MSAETLERSVLEGKDREQLIAIATALGLKALSRAKKGEIIDRILEQTGAAPPPGRSARRTATAAGVRRNGTAHGPGRRAAEEADGSPSDLAAPGRRRRGRHRARRSRRPRPGAGHRREDERLPSRPQDPTAESGAAGPPRRDRRRRRRRPRTGAARSAGAGHRPPRRPQRGRVGRIRRLGRGRRRPGRHPAAGAAAAGRAERWTTGPQGADRQENREPPRATRTRDPREQREPRSPGQPEELGTGEPVQVSGYLDLRDEGYGFLRVNGYLPSRDDVYVSVKQTRQYGLRKGDRVTGLSRIAGRNEKNPALLQILTVNDADPELMRQRPRVRGPHAAVPGREAPPGELGRPDEHDGPDHRPDRSDRKGTARAHRLAAEGRQDVHHEDHRHGHRAEQPRGQAASSS